MHRTNTARNILIAGATVSLLSLTTQAFAACDATRVQYALNNSLPTINSPAFPAALDSYKVQSNASQVRAVPPSGVMDRTYKPDALWVHYDSANKITKLECGN
jgi:hypothetical protein